MDIREFFFNREAIDIYSKDIIKISRTRIKKMNKEIERLSSIKLDESGRTEEFSMVDVSRNLKKYCFKGKTVNSCLIEGIDVDRRSFWGVIRDLYLLLGDIETIRENLTIPLCEGRRNDKGYVYIKDLDISVQGVSAERSMIEIFSQVLGNDLSFRIEISMYPNRLVFFNN